MPCRRILNDKTATHDDHPICDLRHQSHIMTNENQGTAEPVLDVVQRLHHLALGNHVQCAGWFISNDQPRIEHDCDSNADALLHPSGQLMCEHVGHAIRQADTIKRLGHGLICGGLVEHNTMINEAVEHLFADAQNRI